MLWFKGGEQTCTEKKSASSRHLQTFDKNHDGKVSYEEIKHEILRITDGFTLKQMFKAIDFDKDYHLTVLEYLALLNELEIRRKDGNLNTAPRIIRLTSPAPADNRRNQEETTTLSTTAETESEGSATTSAVETTADTDVLSSTPLPFAEIQMRSRRDATQGMIRVMPARVMHEFQFDEEPLFAEKAEGTTGVSKRIRSSARVKFAQGGSRRSKRDGKKEETAPPLESPLTELKREQMRELSAKIKNNLSGGGRSPSIDLSVTVPYDDKDFQ
ncbi:hypothetical protein Y032_0218g2432 [Ancylostoma ceylanicum]|uniref:EF-hand domain-containing protein n=1 Tax=Ancylostoma ceylanicum TaxID=53326 RepID=A0A016SJX4_9BILA|nr:hypothetical protein Y032_0218g2432 [Ancylostoma ceylanicum]